ncbi:hypothetical protein [Brachybacterium sp. Marseille-Q7125]|uniref:hypothetical protein n=1 Tax=Brachybacterium sp. Marseille-Q7125 TaxID=2932815 RepID=UPI001FF0F1AC|nr:hypothetical protein [Brachybacterium sp. Marseille-Q7125]
MSHADSTGHERPTDTDPDYLRKTFTAARGVPADGIWAELALTRLVFADVRIDLAKTFVGTLAADVAAAGESPEELFGPAEEWAAQTVTALREDGVDVFDDPLRMSLRDAVGTAFLVATGIAVLFAVVAVARWLLGGEPLALSASMAVAPGLLGALLTGLAAGWGHLRSRLAFPVLAGLGVLTVIIGALGIALLFQALNPLGDIAPWWGLGLMVLGYGTAAAAVSALPSRKKPPVSTAQLPTNPSPLSDEQWLEQARAGLRERADLPESRVREHLEEARALAQENARSLDEEFGNPRAFARSLSGDPGLAPRRTAVLYAVVAVAWAVLGSAGILERGGTAWMDLIYLALTVLCAWTAWENLRKVRAARRSAR